MDSQRRLIIFLIFSFSLVMLWDAWMRDSRPPPEPVPAVAGDTAGGGQDPSLPTPSLPSPGDSLTAGDAEVPGAAPSVEVPGAAAAGQRTIVRTDMMVAEVAAQGGEIVRLELLKHRATEAPKDTSRNFVLFDNGMRHIYSAQSGLIGEGLPNHRTAYSVPSGELALQDGQDSVTLRLEAPEQDGLRVVKLMTFNRGSYLVDIEYQLENAGERDVGAHAYFQFARDSKPAETVEVFGVSTFTGPAVYTDAEKFQKIQFEDIDEGKAKFATQAKDGWIAMVQHYFVGAWLPPGDTQREFYTRKVGPDLYTAGVILPVGTLAPGQDSTVSMQLYAGPQEQDHLDTIADGLDLVVDYGWLTVIAAPLFWVLSWLHNLTGNWGWAIILVTVLIKLVFFPLSATSYKSMAKMRVLAPRMQKIKELYGHDKAKMQQEVMAMYRNEKINPLGGCLPILVQIPVFIALYWVLLGSVEMRHAPWLGWITDLSSKDPYFILPVIMGASMMVQMKLNPAPPDPIQAKVMMALPIVFTVMFLWFPSGLVLYWVVNNILSIAQQWQITRMIEGAKKSGAKTS